jgi:hypothetical protein
MDLFAHEQLPEFAFGAGVGILNIRQVDLRRGLHLRRRSRSSERSLVKPKQQVNSRGGRLEKSEIRNPKSETNPNFEISTNVQNYGGNEFRALLLSGFEFVSDFEFRILLRAWGMHPIGSTSRF